MNPSNKESKPEKFDLWLFTHDVIYGETAASAGMDGVVVDWEWRGKGTRQIGFDTEINNATPEDLRDMRSRVPCSIACRINNHPHVRVDEAKRASDLGANEVWLPMVESIAEIEECLAVLRPDCRLGILVETPVGIALALEYRGLPLARVYFGLNDFRISAGRPHLFSALIDGAVEDFRGNFDGVFGVGGVTSPALGFPVPCRFLLAEMNRLRCGFGVARRAFRRDISPDRMSAEIREIKTVYSLLARRSLGERNRDHQALAACVRRLEAPAAPLAANAVG